MMGEQDELPLTPKDELPTPKLDHDYDLKPCPFCGKKPFLVEDPPKRRRKKPIYFVKCIPCLGGRHISGTEMGASFDIEKTVEAWNTRHEE